MARGTLWHFCIPPYYGKKLEDSSQYDLNYSIYEKIMKVSLCVVVDVTPPIHMER